MSLNKLKRSFFGYGTSQYEDKKSVFIGEATPIASEDEAREFINNAKKKYHDANHHCYAYSVNGGQICRYSDDSEPQGTAGLPILNIIKTNDVDDVCIVVTRYFGGTLLGTGGLTRAYGEAAKEAAKNAGLVEYRVYTLISVKCSYSDYQKIQTIANKNGVSENGVEFLDSVNVEYAISKENVDNFISQIIDVSANRAVCTKKEDIDHPFKIQ